MTRSQQSSVWLLAVVFLFCMAMTPSTNAFQVTSCLCAPPRIISSTETGREIDFDNSQALISSTMLEAKKKPATLEPEREKNNGLGLLLLYMTPWKNPNSIFVYMLAGLYFLGKYSEAQSAAKAAAAAAGM